MAESAKKADLLRALREQTHSITLPQKEFFRAPNFSQGVARGIVAEMIGNAKTEWLLQLFKLHPEHLILWFEKDFRANPTAIQQRGVDLHRIRFIETRADIQQSLRIALESQHYPFVIAPNDFTDHRIYQRLSLIAEKSKSTIFLLSEKKFQPAWPIALQLEINFNDDGAFEISVARQKHGVL